MSWVFVNASVNEGKIVASNTKPLKWKTTNDEYFARMRTKQTKLETTEATNPLSYPVEVKQKKSHFTYIKMPMKVSLISNTCGAKTSEPNQTTLCDVH